MLLTFGLYLLLGIAAGFVAGLFGIGGGILIVPVLAFCFPLTGMEGDVVMHAAVATSLATIVFTSISSVATHHRAGAIRWSIFPHVVAGILFGALAGSWVASSLSGVVLQVAFGIFALVMASKMAFGLNPAKGRDYDAHPVARPELGIAGMVIGFGSAIFGIGGGSLSVPYLTFRGLKMQQAVATSAAIGLPIAIVGAAGYIWTGWNDENTAQYSLGFIYLPAFFGIVLTSTFAARFGARLAHRLEQKKLKRIFALFLLVVGLKFLASNLF